MLNSQQEDKLIKKSAVVAGLVFVGAVISISAFSQWNPNSAILNRVPYTRRSMIQSPSGTTTTSSRASTIPGTVPTFGSTTAAKRFSTTPDRKTTSSRSFTPLGNITTPSKLPLSIARSTGRTSIAANSSSSQRAKSVERVIDAKATASGLVVARREARIKPHTTTRKKAQDVISLLRHGKTRQAARQARISRAALRQLSEWNQNRL